jgi:hypothetical protein
MNSDAVGVAFDLRAYFSVLKFSDSESILHTFFSMFENIDGFAIIFQFFGRGYRFGHYNQG